MPAPFDKEASSPQGLPDPELNPMTNPLLAKNMGRWAEVYYTSPPEKREEAVQQLLRELREQQNTASHASQKTAEVGKSNAATAPPLGNGICPACLHRNREQDRFCGLCGFPVGAPPEATPQQDSSAAVKTTIARPERTEQSWGWLRDKSLSTLESSPDWEHSRWKYAIAVALVGIALLGGAYFVFTNQHSPPTKNIDSSSQAPAPQTNTAPAPSGDVHPDQGPATNPNPRPEETGGESTGAAVAASPSAVPPVLTPAEDVADDGTQELREGKRYLTGDGVPRDSRSASQWLWRAVAKQNAEAVLLLSDLYIRGDGVPQSCDQARVLLMAAAKRGSAEAGEKLGEIRQSVCR